MTELSDAELRQNWRINWLHAIQAFCDTEIQKSRWLDPAEANPHYSFVECMCCYFDDSLFGQNDPYPHLVERGHLTLEEAEAVAEFHGQADAYQSPNDDDYDVEAILSDRGWHSVVDTAQKAQKKLLILLTDRPERLAIQQPVEWEETSYGWKADTVPVVKSGGQND